MESPHSQDTELQDDTADTEIQGDTEPCVNFAKVGVVSWGKWFHQWGVVGTAMQVSFFAVT